MSAKRDGAIRTNSGLGSEFSKRASPLPGGLPLSGEIERPSKRRRLCRYRFSSRIPSSAESESDGDSQASEYDNSDSEASALESSCFSHGNGEHSSRPSSVDSKRHTAGSSRGQRRLDNCYGASSLQLVGFLRRNAGSLVLTLASQSSSASMNQVQLCSHDLGDQAFASLEELFAAPALNAIPQGKAARARVKFTAAEDQMLLDMKNHRGLSWSKIADHFPGKTRTSLQIRYLTKLKKKVSVILPVLNK